MSAQPVRNLDALRNAFREFTEASGELASSYHALEQQVLELQGQLTEARAAQAAELTAKERLANRMTHLLAALPAGVVVLDGGGIVQEANPAAMALLGEPLVGAPWRAVVLRAFSPNPTDGQDVSLRDGRRVHVATNPIGSEPGQILLIQDVTATRELQETVERGKRLSAMGQMAAALAHQIRTPLSSALLYASHLERPALPDAERLRLVPKVTERLRNLEHLIHDMLLFARGGGVGHEAIAVGELLQEVAAAIEPELAAAGGALRIELETESARIFGNRDTLRSALLNLASNALQACGHRAELVLGAQDAPAGAVDLTVRDNGPGIAPEALPRIFEPFFTTRAQGTGLGLAVVQAIAHAHRGSAWVRSAPGAGTVFGIRLPLVAAQAA